jgi:hypothetical protein
VALCVDVQLIVLIRQKAGPATQALADGAPFSSRPRTIARALEEMRHRYITPTNEALMALATRLQWIALAVDCTDPRTPRPTGSFE